MTYWLYWLWNPRCLSTFTVFNLCLGSSLRLGTPGTWAVAVVLQRVPWSQEVLYHLHRSCRTLESGEKRVTLPETIQNAPGKDKETSIPTIHFIILFYPFSGVKSQLVCWDFLLLRNSQQLYSQNQTQNGLLDDACKGFPILAWGKVWSAWASWACILLHNKLQKIEY